VFNLSNVFFVNKYWF